MKTIEELLLELPLEYRMLALTVGKKRESVHATTKYTQDHAQAVLKGFIWKNTPQGVIFWARVYDALRSKTILPTVIDPNSNLVRQQSWGLIDCGNPIGTRLSYNNSEDIYFRRVF